MSEEIDNKTTEEENKPETTKVKKLKPHKRYGKRKTIWWRKWNNNPNVKTTPLNTLGQQFGEFIKVNIQSQPISDFRIRLECEGLPERDFFRLIISAYLRDDPRIKEILEENMVDEKLISREERRFRQYISRRRAKFEKKINHNLSLKEIENLLDMLEKDLPEGLQ